MAKILILDEDNFGIFGNLRDTVTKVSTLSENFDFTGFDSIVVYNGKWGLGARKVRLVPEVMRRKIIVLLDDTPNGQSVRGYKRLGVPVKNIKIRWNSAGII